MPEALPFKVHVKLLFVYLISTGGALAFADSCGQAAGALEQQPEAPGVEHGVRLGCEGLEALHRRHGKRIINGVVAFEGYEPQGAGPSDKGHRKDRIEFLAQNDRFNVMKSKTLCTTG